MTTWPYSGWGSFGDRGEGPITDLSGWVRTGKSEESGTDSAGRANCFSWSTNAADQYGTAVALTDRWERSNTSYQDTNPIQPWFGLTKTCDKPQHVWCIEYGPQG